MGPNPPLSASASKPIRLGVATAQQFIVTILDSSTTVDVEPYVEDDASA